MLAAGGWPPVVDVPSAPRPAGLPLWGGRYAQRHTAECLAFWGTQCHLCPDPAPADTADHVTPRSKGGSDDLANLRPAHHACNVARRDLWLWEWFALHPLPAQPALPPSREW